MASHRPGDKPLSYPMIFFITDAYMHHWALMSQPQGGYSYFLVKSVFINVSCLICLSNLFQNHTVFWINVPCVYTWSGGLGFNGFHADGPLKSKVTVRSYSFPKNTKSVINCLTISLFLFMYSFMYLFIYLFFIFLHCNVCCTCIPVRCDVILH